jgi:hypothetical protein
LPPPLAKEYGADEAAAAVGPDRRIRLFLGMMIDKRGVFSRELGIM